MPMTTDERDRLKSVIAQAVDATFMQRGFNASRHAEAVIEALSKAGLLPAAQAADRWQDIGTAPNDSSFRWYGLHVQHIGHDWFEAHYLSHADNGEMIEPSGDNFTDWAFIDFEFWCAAPSPPAIIAEKREVK